MLEQRLKEVIREVPDFPSKGVVFKDITPVLQDQILCTQIVDEFVKQLKGVKIDVIAGVESRGFLFGLMLANKLKIPFVPIRKQGKLPCKTISESYKLEYGQATIEVHEDAFLEGSNVLIHDDLLATGGTVVASSKLIEKLGGNVVGYSFVISLDFLNGRGGLSRFSDNIISLVSY
ncbi:adenine phosphoribosyltransferase [Sphingobacterium sp. UT-1RO-CII-1]|uniref:adenine phosphoribosyltransferase n=1 Tax=Sphingobacterium sp. UT-1RO-CII-1 TaxID=2995225 RepID=UPI00227B14DE|nr:adenine phosphoribosyltransferase [Sphingobacterium sp. UT-1RO-CII-1]MCY4779694.1 adenine phosphoribosyltransferase [Sphingobacterium sp. UT-1RO-CII-1]